MSEIEFCSDGRGPPCLTDDIDSSIWERSGKHFYLDSSELHDAFEKYFPYADMPLLRLPIYGSMEDLAYTVDFYFNERATDVYIIDGEWRSDYARSAVDSYIGSNDDFESLDENDYQEFFRDKGNIGYSMSRWACMSGQFYGDGDWPGRTSAPPQNPVR